MELTQHGFLEELLAPIRKDTSWPSYSSALGEFFPNTWPNFASLEENPLLSSSNPPFFDFQTPSHEPSSDQYPLISSHDQTPAYASFLDSSYSSTKINGTPPLLPSQEHLHYQSMVDDEEHGFLGGDHQNQSLEEPNVIHSCKVDHDMEQSGDISNSTPGFQMGLCGKKRSKNKKLEGQPSKNLMAERRRRKRLNDRLSMLRSIVPKISKMDRTSILGDTIEYMKELLDKINNLKEEEEEEEEEEIEGKNQNLIMGLSKDSKPNEVPAVRTSPKFDVERKEKETRIDIYCTTKPGLLLSTVNTLESLGLEIQHCVISCFNDFSVQVSCSQEIADQAMLSSEDIKQALFRNAGYGGRLL